MIFFVSQSHSSKASRLKGTFVSAENAFKTIVFDHDDDETFYFYNQDGAQIGSYEKVEEGSYRINGTS
ncbi:hypothetical protein JCM19046_3486 [Bacillus sp. JCM 19046]|nr:hypothetical protein JCM19046_3486 [Bacillus sp. JCM 19046]